jgi:hypothetical protein
LTLSECRLSRSRQNVKWIEELIGRRQSLSADAVIAVSSSGFTSGAVRKARRYSVMLRDLRKLTDADVAAWGRPVALTLYFYQYSDLELTLCFSPKSVSKIDAEFAQSELASHPAFRSIFNAAAAQIDTAGLLPSERFGEKIGFGVTLSLGEFRLCGETVDEVDLRGRVSLIAQPVSLQATLAYGRPECAPPGA